MKKGGADEWESLRVPEGLSGGRDEKSFGGACVFEQGKKILVLVVQRSNGALTLFTYDAGSNEWEDPKDCDCERFEVLKKGENEWVSLKVPEGLSGGLGPKSFGGSCVFEQGPSDQENTLDRSSS
ncbi:hypothetical protein COLO4_31089 [Corchorus olitorius]|uniref:Uncharacterized protein n=1 Tax=Corchorus olitorius TaxID=93759 RepID=A0A1R3H5N7_9ROSI|nr:hypothetical protein COLO4_31089 [Corchorus olitorius]